MEDREHQKISVIVPVYNTAPYLHRCIDSILAQTFTDFELLLIDDGSTDESGRICDEYADKDGRIRVFHKENGGVSSARNVGLDNATGDWITFCDSDDYVYPCWLDNFGFKYAAEGITHLMQGFEADKSVFGNDKGNDKFVYGIDYGGETVGIMHLLAHVELGGFLFIHAFRLSEIQPHNIRFDTRLRYAEDGVFIFQCLRYCKWTNAVSKIGYYYYVPKWDVKYIKDFETDVIAGESLYESVRIIKKNNPLDETLRYYREDLTSMYIREFARSKKRRRLCIRRLRNILRKDFRHSQLFFLTRLSILADPTYVFSSFILKIHLMLKNSTKWI